jgi:hypothetical protein
VRPSDSGRSAKSGPTPPSVSSRFDLGEELKRLDQARIDGHGKEKDGKQGAVHTIRAATPATNRQMTPVASLTMVGQDPTIHEAMSRRFGRPTDARTHTNAITMRSRCRQKRRRTSVDG